MNAGRFFLVQPFAVFYRLIAHVAINSASLSLYHCINNERNKWRTWERSRTIMATMTMERADTSVSASDLPALQAQFAREGYVAVSGLFTPDEVAEIRETFMAQAAAGPVPGLSDTSISAVTPDDPLALYPRMLHPHKFDDLPVGPLSRRYLLDLRLENVLTALMGEEAIAAQSMFYFKPPGARGQDLHQDNFYLRVAPGTCCAMWLAVDDADEENGGMMVVPGSNALPIACPQESDPTVSFTRHHVPVPDGLEAVPVRLKAGDVLFFNGSVIHGSYPNQSRDRFRRAFICHYVPKASNELSQYYPSLTFGGEPITIPAATGGGPCGTGHEAKGPH